MLKFIILNLQSLLVLETITLSLARITSQCSHDKKLRTAMLYLKLSPHASEFIYLINLNWIYLILLLVRPKY